MSRAVSYVTSEPNWKPAGTTLMHIPNKWILAHDIFLLNDKFRYIATVKYSFNDH